MTEQNERRLFGGLVENRVVQVGETVRRPAGPWTATVQELLGHLQTKGFPAPAPLGLDDQGREVVTFLPGAAALRPWPAFLLTLDGMRQAASLLRMYHTAVAGFVPSSNLWCHGEQDIAPEEIVLHGDFGPYNLIHDGQHLTGVIDWDLIRPGLPVEDAAFAATQLVPLRPDEIAQEIGFLSIPDRASRLAAFAEAYGSGLTSADLIAAAKTYGARDLAGMRVRGAAGREPWASFLRHGLAERTASELSWLEGAFPAQSVVEDLRSRPA